MISYKYSGCFLRPIVKTRQDFVMAKPKSGTPKGILNPKEGKQQFRLSRFMPTEELKFFVEHYWIVEWDLGDESFQQEILAYPSVHLAFEKEKTQIWGVVTGKFSRTIEGSGKVLDIKFRPGGFYPFLKSSVSSFSDETLDLDAVFDVDPKKVETKVLHSDDKEEMVARAEEFLLDFLPKEDERITFVNQIIEAVIADQLLMKVEELADRFELSKRTLQRIFKRYVGVSPKWVIKRYRLHEVAAQLAEKEDTDWAALAVELGYFDQSHFIKDFKSIVGKAPAEYASEIHS